MTRMKRWWRGMSRRTVLGAGMAAVVVIGLLTVSLSSVFAVYDLGLFELDGDATDDPAVEGEDWDLIYETYMGTADPESESDALLFVADKMGTMDDSFTEGSKDIDDIPDWVWTEKSVPDKNELTNAYAAVYPDDGDTIIYFGADRYDTSGAAYMGFWFFQDRVEALPDGSFSGQHQLGDMLVLSDFTNGGEVSTIKVYEWVGSGGSHGSLNLLYEGAECSSSQPGDLVCATVNKEPVDAPWPYTPKSGIDGEFPTSAFFEGGLNLTQLLPNYPGCYSSFMAETRASDSVTAQLKDFALGEFDLCSIDVTKTGPEKSKVGDDVTYTITVENTGVKSLEWYSITDTLAGELSSYGTISDTCSNETLLAGGTCQISYDYTVPAGAPDPLVNEVTAVYYAAQDAQLQYPVSDWDEHSVNLFQPAIELTKTGDELSKIGDTVDYTITLTNNSSLDTPDLECTVTDAVVGVNETFTITAGTDPYVINVYDFEIPEDAADPFVNTAYVTCSPEGFPNEYNDEASWETNLFQPAIEFDKTGDELSKIGDLVDYTITLTNTSSADTPDLTCTITDTLVGVDETFTIGSSDDPHVVNVYDFEIPEGADDPFVNTAYVTCSPEGFPNEYNDEASWETELFQPAIEFDKTGDELSKIGDLVDYTITLTNTSSADTPDLTCTITDTLVGVDETFTIGSSDDPHVINVYDFEIPEGADDPFVNTAYVTCSPEGFPNEYNDEASWETSLFQPAIELDKVGDELSKIGDTVDYTITLTNTSSADTPNLQCTVTDALVGVDEPFTIASGAEPYVISVEDFVIPADAADPFVNTAEVTCSPIGFTNVYTDEASWETQLFQPAIELTKTGDGLSKIGDTVDYTITLTNNSSDDTPDLSCTVTDEMVDVDETFTIGSGDDPHVVNVYDFVIPEDANDPFINTAEVTCSPIGFTNVYTDEASWETELFQPSIEFDKTGDELSKIGDLVDYTITLTNNSSDDTPDLECEVADPTLSLTETFTIAWDDDPYVINVDDFEIPESPDDPFINTAEVTCSPIGFSNVYTDEASWETELFQPSINVVKTGPDYSKVGDTAEYQVVITNTSSTDTPPLMLVSFSDSLVAGVTPPAACDELSSGESCTFSYDYVVEAGDDSGEPGAQLENTATAVYSPDGFPNQITDDDGSNAWSLTLLHPDFTLTKECATPIVKAGEDATFDVVFANAGDVDLVVEFDEDLTGEGCPDADTPVTVEAGDSLVCTVDKAADTDPLESYVENTINASVTLPEWTDLDNAWEDSAYDLCQIYATKAGTKFEDLNADGVWDDGEPGIGGWTIDFWTLDAGGQPETKVYTATTDGDGNYLFDMVVPGQDYLICEVLPSAWAQSYPGEGAAECPTELGYAPYGYLINLASGEVEDGNDFGNWAKEGGIELQKYVSVDDEATWHDADSPTGPTTQVGEDVYFRFVVTNTGELTLSDITLTDSDFDLSACTLTDPLDPGESFECVIGPFPAEAGQHVDTGRVTGDYGEDRYWDEDDAHCLGVDASIVIEADGTNDVGDSHTFTLIVTAIGAEPTDWVITPTVSPTPDSQSDTCDNPDVAGDGMSATCELTINNSDPGQFSASAEADVTFASSTVVSVETDGEGDNSEAAVKTYVDAAIQLSPLEAVNLVGDPHTITATVQVDDGSGGGWTDAPDGTVVTFTLPTNTANADFVGENTCETVDGQCSVQINADEPGEVEIHAATDVSVGGLILHRETDGQGDNTGDASKTYAEAGIELEKYVSVDDEVTWHDADSPTGPVTQAGEDVYFKFVVTNTGEVELSDIDLTDSDFATEIGEQCDVPATLAAGDSFECVIGPVEAIVGQHENTGEVTGEYEGNTYSDDDPAHYFGEAPTYTFEKYVNGEDADTRPEAVDVKEGDTLTFTYTLTNTGNIPITWTELDDDVFGNLTTHCELPIELDVGEAATCVYTSTAGYTEEEQNGKRNIGTVSVEGLEDQEDPAWYRVTEPTPVELLYFRAQGTGSAIRLEWASAAEVNVSHFYVYRAESNRFGAADRIEFVNAKGSGSTYQLLDEDVEPGKMYWYWLQSVDYDGYRELEGPVQASMVASLPGGGQFRIFLPLVRRGF